MGETVLPQKVVETRNESEKIFEQYLDSNGFKGKWTHEPSMPGKSKKPDYLLDYNSQKCFFEVKELREKPNELTEGHINPYPTSLRAEINEARKQFKEYKDYCCSLVVFNVDDIPANLDHLFVLSSMLGNLGFAMTFNVAEGKAVDGSERNVFLDGGKMIDYKRKQSQNTTISTIIVLKKFPDDSEYQKAKKEEMKKQNKPLTGIEMFAFIEEIGKNYRSTYVTRVVVVENPFARKPLPEDLFNGPFDERWRWTKENGAIDRVFVGSNLRELEELKDKS